MYKGCVDYLKGLDSSMKQQSPSTPAGGVDYLRVVDSSRNQHSSCTLE